MAPRKRHLLDLLREREATGSGAEGGAPAPRTAPRPRNGPLLPAWAAYAALGLAAVLVLALGLRFLGGGASGGDAPEPGAAASGVSSAAGSGAEPAAGARPYGVLAITFSGEENLERAQQVAAELMYDLGFPDVGIRRLRDGDRVFYEVYVGRAGSPSELEDLLQRLRTTSPPSRPGETPFADALVKRIPSTS